MSYSFSFNAPSKSAALAEATRKFDEIISSQPVHHVDRSAALANLERHLSLLPDPGAGEEILGKMDGLVAGEINWESGEVRRLKACGSNCSLVISVKVAA